MVDKLLENYINDNYNNCKVNWLSYYIVKITDNNLNEIILVRCLNNVIVYKNDKLNTIIKTG